MLSLRRVLCRLGNITLCPFLVLRLNFVRYVPFLYFSARSWNISNDASILNAPLSHAFYTTFVVFCKLLDWNTQCTCFLVITCHLCHFVLVFFQYRVLFTHGVPCFSYSLCHFRNFGPIFGTSCFLCVYKLPFFSFNMGHLVFFGSFLYRYMLVLPMFANFVPVLYIVCSSCAFLPSLDVSNVLDILDMGHLGHLEHFDN